MKSLEQMKAELKEYEPLRKALMRKHGMSGHLDPGGAELHHPTFGKLRISAYDERDDYETIVEFLRRHGAEP